MAPSDYISEFKSPSLKLHDDGSLPSPYEIDAYFSYLEQMRQDFISFVSDKDERVLKAYLKELISAKEMIEKRGFVTLRNDNLAAAYASGQQEAHTFMALKGIDSRLLTSAESTISFVESVLGDGDDEKEKPIQVAEPNNNEDDIIRGVNGLAKFLGCGTTKAQAIINSGILAKTKPTIQYNAGGWRFYKKRLQEFIENNPAPFSHIKCPH